MVLKNDATGGDRDRTRNCSGDVRKAEKGPSKYFIQQIIEDDIAAGKNGGRVMTRSGIASPSVLR